MDPYNITIVTNDTNYDYLVNLTPSMFFKTAINLLLGVAGVASFVFLIWGGLQWITAGGDKDAMEKSRKKIINSLIGLAIVFSSYTIIYVLRALFNVDLIGFNLSSLGT